MTFTSALPLLGECLGSKVTSSMGCVGISTQHGSDVSISILLSDYINVALLKKLV